MIKLENFFGLSIEPGSSDIQHLLETLNIESVILSTKVVKSLIKQNGRNAAIVGIAIRQQALKAIRHLLLEDMLDFDPNYYQKEINTSSEHDRRYGAEDRLLDFALLIASTKSQKVMQADPRFISVKRLREAAFKGTQFEYCWNVLSDESTNIVSAYRKSKK